MRSPRGCSGLFELTTPSPVFDMKRALNVQIYVKLISPRCARSRRGGC